MKSLPAILFCLCSTAPAQTFTFNSNPTTLIAGGGAQTLTITSVGNLASIPYIVTWNGTARSFQIASNNFPYGINIAVSLTAGDLSVPQLGQFALYDGRNNALVGTLAVPVVYPVTAAGILYDASRGRLYITTGASSTPPYPAPSYSPDPRFPPNSLMSIDVQTGNILNTVPLGAPGGALALSDDNSALYVAVAPGIVRRVDPVAFAGVGDFSVQSGGTFGSNVKNLAIMPDASSTLAIEYFTSNGTGLTVGIFDGGILRAKTVGNPTAAFSGLDKMLFSPDGKYLFVGDAGATDRYPIDSSGFASQTPVTTRGGPPLSIIGNTVYTRNGVLLNWQSMQIDGNLGGPFALAADPVNSRILATFAPPQYSPYAALLQAFDLVSQAPLGTLQLPIAPVNLYRFGADGLIEQSLYNVFFFHTPLAGPAPFVTPDAIVSAASFQIGPVAPGEIVSIFGTSLGPAAGAPFTVTGSKVNAPAGVEVWFGKTQGTVLFASPGQINAVTPFGLAPGSDLEVQVVYNGIPSLQRSIGVVATAPSLITRDGSGTGLVAEINQDGTINAPAPAGSIVSLYGTGGGIYPGAADGVLASGISQLSANVQVTIGGQNAQVFYAGAAPALISSAFQLNVQIPSGTPPGAAVPIVLTIGGQTTPQGVTIEVR